MAECFYLFKRRKIKNVKSKMDKDKNSYKNIFDNDPFGLLNVKLQNQSCKENEDERLLASFH